MPNLSLLSHFKLRCVLLAIFLVFHKFVFCSLKTNKQNIPVVPSLK